MLQIFSRKDRSRRFSYRCACCGEVHSGSPTVGYKRPNHYFTVPEGDRDDRVTIDDDLCEIRPPADNLELGTSFFIRTTLDVPIHGADEPFSWGVWVSQSEQSFCRYVDTFDDDQSGMGSFGWLVASMPGYGRLDENGGIESVACDVVWKGDGQRPTLEVHECDHPLFVDQRDGISWERAVELAQQALHPN